MSLPFQTGHRWVGTLASFEFTLEYQKGADNGAANALSRVLISHDHTTVCSLLEGAIIGAADQSEAEANEALFCEHVHSPSYLLWGHLQQAL